MRTEQLNEFEENLSELNNCFSHYIFVWDQFSTDYKEIITLNKNKLTSEIFKNNVSNRQHNVLLSHLENSHNETQNLILKSIYQLAYGYFESYLIKLHQFAQKLDNKIVDLQQKIEINEDDPKVFDKFLNRLNISFKDNFDELEETTLDYIRHRRNRITHRATTTQGAVLEIINNHGEKLNKYWDKKLKNKRYSLDFSRKNVDIFDKLELFDFINIYRKLSKKIDAVFISQIGEMKLLEFIIERFEESSGKKIRGLTEERKKEKFKRFCITKFAYEIKQADLEKIKFMAV